MRLYFHPLSTNARRALLTVAQLGIPVEKIVVDLAHGAQRTPEFLQLNPNHRVPVLDDDGFVLWESHAIMQYLAERTPGQSLYPAELRARADINRWMFWSAAHFMPAIGILNWENHIKGMIGQGAADPAEVARGEAQFREFGAVLDQHLAQRSWVCGDALSLADLALAAPLADIAAAKLPVAGLNHLLRWFDAMRALPAWKATEPTALRAG